MDLPEGSQFDQVDARILTVLAQHGRITVTDLSEKVGLSKTPCLVRMRRMEEQGLIRGYRAVLDMEMLERAHIAFVQVTLSDSTTHALDRFNAAVRKVAEIEQCHMIASSFDYLLKVRTRDIAEYRRLLGETIAALPHVIQTSTFVAMETVKDDPI